MARKYKNTEKPQPAEKTADKQVIEIINNFRYARECKKDWIKEATEDLEFLLGKQWKTEDARELEKAGVRALTVNKVSAIMRLLAGLQRQNKSDFKAFPIGTEDQIKSDIATKLLKNVMNDAEGVYKISEQFTDGAGLGEGWLEPYIDYTDDMLNGRFGLKKGNPFSIYVDPSSKEYDLSDAEYVIKFSPDLTKNQLKKLFPKKADKIEKIKDGKLTLDGVKEDTTGENKPHNTLTTGDQYAQPGHDGTVGFDSALFTQPLFDLTEYYYKNYIMKYYVANRKTGEILPAKDKADADDFITKATQLQKDELINQRMQELSGNPAMADQTALDNQRTIIQQEVDGMSIEASFVVIDRLEPEIRVCSIVGNTEKLSDELCWSFPKWKGYPFNRFMAYVNTIPLKNKELSIQGFIRQLKSPQIEINKSRTLEMRHLNEVANSGWFNEEGAWVDKKAVEKYGSTPGIILEYKKGLKDIPHRILPQLLSTGHNRISADATQDMKEISGINTDLLAMAEGGQASGRAIALRQKQGLIMVQEIFDNLSRSQKQLGRFILSILSELFTIETAVKVVGEIFIQENFTEPIMVQDPESGQPVPQIDPITGGIASQVNNERVIETFTTILEDSGLGRFDVSIGEGINTETTKLANYSILEELRNAGYPIPPDIIIEESSLSSSSKERILKAFEQAKQVESETKTKKKEE